MNKNLSDLAREYAKRPYPFQVFRDDEGDNETRYLAKNPDLEGCMAQGATQAEAIANLAEARYDLIEFLLERGLPIPEPSVIQGSSEVQGIKNLKITTRQSEPTIDDILDSTFMAKAIEKEGRELLYEASLETSVVTHSDDYIGMNIRSSSLGDTSGYNDEKRP